MYDPIFLIADTGLGSLGVYIFTIDQSQINVDPGTS